MLFSIIMKKKVFENGHIYDFNILERSNQKHILKNSRKHFIEIVIL